MQTRLLIITVMIFGFSISLFDSVTAFGETELESIKKWADTPTLHVYGESASVSQYPFVEFKEGQYGWLDKAIKEKAVLMNTSDISQYLDLIGHDEIWVKYIDSERFIKYYALRLSDSDLDLNKHNVRAFYQYFTPQQFSSVSLDEDTIPQYLRYILEEHQWTELTDDQFKELNSQMEQYAKNYQVIKKNNASSYWHIAYVGPDLEEVRQELFENRQEGQIDVLKSTFDVVPDSNCIDAKSRNHANDLVPYYERFSVTDPTGKEIRRINHGNPVIIQFNPYNDWAENFPHVF